MEERVVPRERRPGEGLVNNSAATNLFDPLCAQTENLMVSQSGPPIRAARYGISIARKNRPALVALTFSTRTWPLVSTSGLASNVQLPMGCVTFVVL
jgi:hypothetical protein